MYKLLTFSNWPSKIKFSESQDKPHIIVFAHATGFDAEFTWKIFISM